MKHYPESRSQTEPSSPSWTNRRESGPENINCKVCRDLSKQREKYSKDPADTGCVCVPGLDIPYSPHVQHTKESNRNSMLLQSKTIHDERDDHGSCINRLTLCPFLSGHRELSTVLSLKDCFGNVNIRLLVKHVDLSHGVASGMP
jgi:hypothetical protein